MDGTAQATVFDPAAHSHLTPYLAGLHAQCITRDLMIGSFLPPLTNDKLLNWWKDRIAETKAGTRVIILLLNEAAPGAKVKGEDLVGVAMLATPHAETSPFRARVESLLVAAKYRGRRGSVTLMNAIHGQATLKGKTLLMTEAESGSIAEKVFKKLGYEEIGKVPNYSLNASSMRDHWPGSRGGQDYATRLTNCMKDEIDEVENAVAEKRKLIRESQGNLMGGPEGADV